MAKSPLYKEKVVAMKEPTAITKVSHARNVQKHVLLSGQNKEFVPMKKIVKMADNRNDEWL